MKRFLIGLLLASIGFNVYYLSKKIEQIQSGHEQIKLHQYKKISHKKGFAYFKTQINKTYPEINSDHKYFIVYRWDSLFYDFIHGDQMKTLDSMAAGLGQHSLEYVFVTEMEEQASKNYLKRSEDEYKHVKMLYGMDDFISGLYSIDYIHLKSPKVITRKSVKTTHNNFKQDVLYLIMDSEGKILYTNGNMYMPIKDTTFLHKLYSIQQKNNVKILN